MKKHLILVFLLLSGITMAQTTKELDTTALPQGEVAKSKQSVTLDGKVVPLLAEAGTLQLKDENNKPITREAAECMSKFRVRCPQC